MRNTRKTQEWIEISEYDMLSAKAMLETRRFLYVAFMRQQAIEKILKAVYVQEKKNLPPRTHNSLYLTDIVKIDLFCKTTLAVDSRVELKGFSKDEFLNAEKGSLLKEIKRLGRVM